MRRLRDTTDHVLWVSCGVLPPDQLGIRVAEDPATSLRYTSPRSTEAYHGIRHSGCLVHAPKREAFNGLFSNVSKNGFALFGNSVEQSLHLYSCQFGRCFFLSRFRLDGLTWSDAVSFSEES